MSLRRVLWYLKWQVVVPIGGRLGLSRQRLGRMRMPRWLRGSRGAANAFREAAGADHYRFLSTALHEQRFVNLSINESMSEKDAYRQLADMPSRMLVGNEDEFGVVLRMQLPAGQSCELLIPRIDDEPIVPKASVLCIASVSTNVPVSTHAELFHQLGFSKSKRVGWFQYSRLNGSGAMVFNLQPVNEDIEIHLLLRAWEADDILTDLSGIRLFRQIANRPRIGPISDSVLAKVGKVRPISNLRIAGIADPMTVRALNGCAELELFTRHAFNEQLQRFEPDLVFVESAWRGNSDQWRYAIGHYGGGSQFDLFQLLHAARAQSVPTAFWNKEDPIHFEKFASAASQFDHVATTDSTCLARYRRAFSDLSCSVMQFFVLPDVHNPFDRKESRASVCFAGSYYGDRHSKRSREQEELLDAFVDQGLDIFDRNHNQPNSPFRYPERFMAHVRGGVPYEQMPEIYKSYDWFLNVNTVTDSPTMYARRVPELLASGSGVITNPSLGIRETFRHGVREFADSAAMDSIASLLSPETVHERLLAAMLTLYFHSVEQRFAELATRVTGTRYRSGWREFVLLLDGSEEWLGSSQLHRQLEALEHQGILPELVVVRGGGMSGPQALSALEDSLSRSVVFVSEGAESQLKELASRGIALVVANEICGPSVQALLSLIVTRRVCPAMVTGMAQTPPDSMVGLARKLQKQARSGLQGPWVFSSSQIELVIRMLKTGTFAKGRIDTSEFGLSWSVAPALSDGKQFFGDS